VSNSTQENALPEAQDVDLGLALDSYDTLDIARMDVFVPGGIRPIGWIEFCGPGHPKAVQLSNEAQRRGLHEARDRAIKGTRWKPPERTPDQVNEETQKWVVDRIDQGHGDGRRGEHDRCRRAVHPCDSDEVVWRPEKDLAAECGGRVYYGHRKFYAELVGELADAARAHFELDIPNKEGRSARQLYEGLQDRTGKPRPELDVSLVPEAAMYLFLWFSDLASERQGGFGPQPITSSAIRDWAWRKQLRLRPWEGDALKILDRVYLRTWSDINQEES
jgi:hypothetical protein